MRQRALARHSQIEAPGVPNDASSEGVGKRSEGGVHSETMDDDGGSIWQSRSKPFVSFLPSGLIMQRLA